LSTFILTLGKKILQTERGRGWGAEVETGLLFGTRNVGESDSGVKRKTCMLMVRSKAKVPQANCWLSFLLAENIYTAKQVLFYLVFSQNDQ